MATIPPDQPVPWLTMLYMAGDNELTEEMVLALQDLVGPKPLTESKIVAQFDPSGVGLETQRYIFPGSGGKSLEDHRDTSSIRKRSIPEVSRP